LKLENLLLNHNLILKIADFGLASNQEKNTTHAGTKPFMAPEIKNNQNRFIYNPR